MIRPQKNIEEIAGAEAREILRATNGHARPRVFRGLCSHWPLVRSAEDAAAIERYLLSHYEQAPVTAFIGEPGNEGRIFYDDEISTLNFQQIKTRLDDVLERIRHASTQSPSPTVYMGSMALDHCLPGIRTDNSLPAHDLAASVRIWIGNQSRVAAHYDVMDNIACVCAGKRQFMLFPPQQLTNLYLGPIDLTPAGQQVSLVDPENPDFDRFPRYADALEHAQFAELQPGDAIYIPSMWWHQVNALSPFNLLINHWWRDLPSSMGAPADVLLHALMNLRDLPKRQRDAWRQLFDHYIFAPPADGLDHIPVKSRGVLGDLSEDQMRQLRMNLRNKLNR
ncbi:MAG: cupin-like domain-containing protein [Wenzhouxiangellaceae bacterium]|nr:cupin-like domain-containing protein [Wenzhouxiangellaceae bacterium]